MVGIARVEIGSQAWGVIWDRQGNAQQATVTIRNLDGTPATHYEAVEGGTGATTSLLADLNGTLGRFIAGGSYLLDVPLQGIVGRRVEAVSGSVESDVAVTKEAPINVAHSEYGASAAASAAANDTAFDAAEAALPSTGGEIYIPHGLYSRSTPLKATKAGTTYVGDGRDATIINNNVGNVFEPGVVAQNIDSLTVKSLRLAGGSTGGHAVAPLGGIQMSTFDNVRLDVAKTDKKVWHHPAGTGMFIDMLFKHCWMTVPAASTVAAFYVASSSGLANRNSIEQSRLDGGDAEPFFLVEEQSAGSYSYQWTMRELTFEVCRGGLIHAYGAHRWRLEDIGNYDMASRGASVKDAIRFDKYAGGLVSTYNEISNYMRAAGTLGGGLYDIHLVTSNTQRTTLRSSDQATLGTGMAINCGSEPGTIFDGVPRSATLSNVHTSTVGTRSGTGSTVTSKGCLQFGSNVQVYSTVAPASGAWLVGDIVWNTVPAAAGTPGWVCTTAGSPGTWKAMAVLAA